MAAVKGFVKLPEGFYITKSRIHGRGLFSKVNIKKGDYLFPIYEDNLWSKISDFVNHGGPTKANLTYLRWGENLYGIAHRAISPEDEILADYDELLRIRPDLESEIRFW